MIRSGPGFRVLLVSLPALVGQGGCASVSPLLSVAQVETGLAGCPMDDPLTVEGAVACALARDPQLRELRHRVNMAWWKKVQASLPANPTLTVSADPAEWTMKLSAHLADLMDLGGRRRALVTAEQSREQRAAQEVLLREIELVRQVRKDFAEAWSRRQIAELGRQRVELLEELVALARGQRELGEVGAAEVLRLERALAEARMSLREQELLERLARGRLNRRLGLPLAAEPPLARPDLDGLFKDSFTGEEGGIDLGRLRRPELAMIAAEAGEHQALLTVARVQWLADMQAGPLLRHEEGSSFVGGEVAVVLPLFDRGQARQALHAAALAALEERMLAVQASLLLEVHEAVLRLRHTRRILEADTPAIRAHALAEQELLGQAGELGEISPLEARRGRLTLLEAEMALEQARLNHHHALADLAAAVGDRGEKSDRIGTDGKD